MSGEKRRHRWRRGPVLVEENLTIDSKSITTTTRIEEEKHTENIRRKWYDNDENELQPTSLLPTETISEKIERILRKINAWTNDASPTSTNNDKPPESLQDISFNKTDLSTYDEIRQRQQYKSRFTKPTSSSLLNSLRQRCCSSAQADSARIPNHQIPVHRPYSMAFIDEPLPPCLPSNDNDNCLHEGQDRKVRERVQ